MTSFGDSEARDLRAAWRRFFGHFCHRLETDSADLPEELTTGALELRASATRVARRVSFSESERELCVVHTREQSDLLAEASHIKVALRSSRRVLLGARHAHAGLVAWRARVREELRFARADGADVPLALATIARRAPAQWPEARDLAFSALSLAATTRSRLAFVRAWLAAADPSNALDQLKRVPYGAVADTALLRAAASDLCCELAATSEWLEAALPTEDGAYAAVLLTGLALLRGDTQQARRALDRMQSASTRETSDALQDLAARLPGWRRHTDKSLPEVSARSVFELLCSHDPRTRRIAFLLIEEAP